MATQTATADQAAPEYRGGERNAQRGYRGGTSCAGSGGSNAQRRARDDGDYERGGHQNDGRRDALQDQTQYRLAVIRRLAEVAGQDVAEIDRQLLVDGLSSP